MMSAISSREFYETRNLFRSYIDYTQPLSYEEWVNCPDDFKAAVLYCQFFNEITLAWYKLASVYSTGSDGVDEVLQYLSKNVPLIVEDRRRFSPAYIYKIVYNCLYCLCRDPNRYKKIYENECSNIQHYGEDEVDLFDTYDVHVDAIEAHNVDYIRSKIWQIVESLGDDAVLVVAKILGDSVDWRTESSKKITKRDFNKISADREVEVIDKLREMLKDYASIFC